MQTNPNTSTHQPLTGTPATGRAAEPVRQRPSVAPRVDVYETRDELVLVADLPGVARDQVKIDVVDDRLTLTATRTPTAGASLAREFAVVDFARSFVLPDGLDRAAIAAELTAGVLTLRLPKAQAVKPRRIEVKAG